MNKPKKLTKPNKLFADGPDWILDKNLGHWYCQIDSFKAFIWEEDLTKPVDGKLSKSNNQEEKIIWDGICSGVPGGPEYALTQEPILNWIRNAITERIIK